MELKEQAHRLCCGNTIYLLMCDDFAHVTLGGSPTWDFLIKQSLCMNKQSQLNFNIWTGTTGSVT